LEAKDKRVAVEVEVGSMNETYAEILSGLEEGQEVVVGMTKQQDGSGVTIRGAAVKVMR
jgi:multidrug efflux pump subunit AcrA (membrane-fusion protein)